MEERRKPRPERFTYTEEEAMGIFGGAIGKDEGSGKAGDAGPATPPDPADPLPAREGDPDQAAET